jgi:hypothetical protein
MRISARYVRRCNQHGFTVVAVQKYPIAPLHLFCQLSQSLEMDLLTSCHFHVRHRGRPWEVNPNPSLSPCSRSCIGVGARSLSPIQIDLDIPNHHQVLHSECDFLINVGRSLFLLIYIQSNTAEEETYQGGEPQVAPHDLSALRKVHGLNDTICYTPVVEVICNPSSVHR